MRALLVIALLSASVANGGPRSLKKIAPNVGKQSGRASPPQAVTVTSSPTAIGAVSMVLNGTGNPKGSAATGWFRYYTSNPTTCTDSGGTRAPSSSGTSLGSGSSAVAFTQLVTGLTAGTTYYLCALVSNSGGTSGGSVVTQATPAAYDFTFLPDSPAVTECSGAATYEATVTGGTVALTFTRATAAFCTKGDGTMVSLAADKPRVRRVSSKNRITLEPASTNYVLQSQTLTTCPGNGYGCATGGVITSSNSGTAPDGTATADRITNTDPAGGPYQALTVPSGLTFTASTYYKGVSGGASPVAVGFYCGGAGSAMASCTCARDDGLTVARVSSVTNECICTGTVPTTWVRMEARGTCGGAAGTSATLELFAGDYTTNSSTAYVWGNQLEPTAVATSYIPTTTVAVARGAEAASFTGTFPFGGAPSMAVSHKPLGIFGGIKNLIGFSGSADEFDMFVNDDDVSIEFYQGGPPEVDVYAQSATSLVAATEVRMATWYDGATLNMKVASDTGTTSSVLLPNGSYTAVKIGWYAATIEAGGEYGDIIISNSYTAGR